MTALKRLSLLLVPCLLLYGCGSVSNSETAASLTQLDESPTQNESQSPFPEFKTNFANTSVDLKSILDGGPGKDGIPAIKAPKFVQINQAKIQDDTMGILVEVNNERRFYPYNILAWHEVVNDQIGGEKVAITFCPLCGSALVFSRQIGDEIVEFGVSGLLYESNLLMYDTKTESLWSQVLGKAIAGDHNGTELNKLPFKRLTVKELKDKYSDAMVLKRITNSELSKQYPHDPFLESVAPRDGESRNYDALPYENYDQVEELYFPVSVQDKRFPSKQIMYVVPYKDRSVAIPYLDAFDGATQLIASTVLTINKNGSEIQVVNSEGEELVGYFEMWFSWSIHHQEDGVIWEF